MNYEISYVTHIGRRRKNEDALLFLRADTAWGPAAFAVVCDGMGGLSFGELASAEVIRAAERWFCTELPRHLSGGIRGRADSRRRIAASLNEFVLAVDRRLGEFGKQRFLQLGTTASALLLIDGRFSILHIGDSRVYRYRRGRLLQLTHDQTLAERQVREGLLRAGDADASPESNVLLMSVGAGEKPVAEMVSGRAGRRDIYLLCTDGFRRKVGREELRGGLERAARDELEPVLREIAGLAASRGESDNMTAVIVRTYP